MSEHATVEQNKLVSWNRKESEPVEMSERSNFELCVVYRERRQPRKYPSLSSSKWNFRHCPNEVTVTDENSHLIASRHFHFQSIISASLKERACEPDIHFLQILNESRVEESIKVGLFVSEPKIRVVTGNAVEMNLRNCSELSDEVLGEKLSTFVDLLETDKLQFIRLVRIDAFAINNISEKEHKYAVYFQVRCYLGGLFGDSLKARSCFAGVPSGSPPAVVKI